MEKTRTVVRVSGKEYAISSYDSEEYVRRVAMYVDRKIGELELATRLPAVQVAVLTAVNIADDMIKAQDTATRLRKELVSAQQALEQAQKEIDRLKNEAGDKE